MARIKRDEFIAGFQGWLRPHLEKHLPEEDEEREMLEITRKILVGEIGTIEINLTHPGE